MYNNITKLSAKKIMKATQFPINKNILTIEKPSVSPSLPLIFDSPHSGTLYPNDFSYNCDLNALRKMEDAHVDALFSNAPQHGATLLRALFPRSYIDPNRSIDDIDETILKEPWPEDLYDTLAPTELSEQGIGLIPINIALGKKIYNDKLCIKDVLSRINCYYIPYHKTLKKIIDTAHTKHGYNYHINLHSMPSSMAYPNNSRKASDIVLGTLDGYSCEPSFVHELRHFWEEEGYTVTINDPFKGAQLIAGYGQPFEKRNSIQIEINRTLYMDESTQKPNSSFKFFKEHCTQMIAFCANYCHAYSKTSKKL